MSNAELFRLGSMSGEEIDEELRRQLIDPAPTSAAVTSIYEAWLRRRGRSAATTGLRPIGLAKGDFVVPDDFDAPLPDDVLDEFEGK